MLHLDPSKRLPLSRVLDHKWMTQGVLPEPLTNHVTPRVFGSNSSLIWNDQVLLAIQRMKYNVDACKEVRECEGERVRE